MYHEDKLVQLLTLNEDWLISKILVATKNFNQTENLSLNNHSCRQTIGDLSKVLVKYNRQFDQKSSSHILLDIESAIFQTYTKNEALKYLKLSIEPFLYLSFLKIIKEAYEELILESVLETDDKNLFCQLFERCFNCIEVVFIKEWSKLNEKPHNHSKQKLLDEKKINSIFNTLPIPVIIVNSFHRIEKFNPSARSFFPKLFENNELEIRKLLKIKQKDSINAKIDEFIISRHKESDFETEIATHAGNFYVLINLRKLDSSDCIMMSFTDLSRWKKTEENLESSIKKSEESVQSKTQFLANMSHEIRTPMNAIVGFSELLTITNPGLKESTEYLEIIKKSSNDLLNIIEDVIDIAKIESKELKICYKATKPAEILSDLKCIFDEALKRQDKSQVKILLRIPENEKDLTFRSDPKRLKQVLSNLLGNACKFTKRGTIEIGYKIAENKLVYFFVKDTGMGIPKHMQSNVFNRFVQVEKSYTKNHNGTGLGLAICKNLVSLLGGNIWVSSIPRKGSNFYFYLPNIKFDATKKQTPTRKNSEHVHTDSVFENITIRKNCMY